jgi:lipopolysaccharide export LptBFGC system permease protein LptF
MIKSIKSGVNAINERIALLDDEDTKNQLIETKKRVEIRLEEILDMDNISHIHDRLTPILSFLSSDPIRPLGQDKFKALEKKDSKTKEKFGYNLFFPKTIGDLVYLGDNNGWCVNYHRSYADNVINRGNILVGICEEGTDSSKENVIALAHFVNEGKGQYQLEQLKWSSRTQKGNRNVDASKSFNYNVIKSIICEHLESLKDKGEIK